jgi:hypothetical protein
MYLGRIVEEGPADELFGSVRPDSSHIVACHFGADPPVKPC